MMIGWRSGLQMAELDYLNRLGGRTYEDSREIM
jgi:hypothetical protein